MPGMLKNLIDWTSRFRPQPFDGKHGLLMSASPSMGGGNRGLWALRMPLEHLGARIYPDMFSLAQAHKALVEGDIADAALPSTLRKESAGVPVARRSGEALPVHQARVGRVPRRAARLRSGSRGPGAAMNGAASVENLVLGGGEAGKYIAWDLAQAGRPVVVIERALIGGSCRQHRLLAEQERDPQRQGRGPDASRRRRTAFASTARRWTWKAFASASARWSTA